MDKLMKYLSIFLILAGSFILIVSITRSDKYDIGFGLLALALGLLAYKNYK